MFEQGNFSTKCDEEKTDVGEARQDEKVGICWHKYADRLQAT